LSIQIPAATGWRNIFLSGGNLAVERNYCHEATWEIRPAQCVGICFQDYLRPERIVEFIVLSVGYFIDRAFQHFLANAIVPSNQFSFPMILLKNEIFQTSLDKTSNPLQYIQQV
jgi:hypothetical protein